MTLKPPHETFVRTDAELMELWRDLMGAGGFDLRSLWMIFIADTSELQPVVMPFEHLPDEPTPVQLDGFAQVVRGLAADGAGSAALLLSRPGPAQMTESDRRWARGLRAILGPALCRWPIHLATHGRVQVFAPDDLVGV